MLFLFLNYPIDNLKKLFLKSWKMMMMKNCFVLFFGFFCSAWPLKGFNTYFQLEPLRLILKFHLIFWIENFLERHSFRRVSGDSLKTLRKLFLSTKFPHRNIRWSFSILHSEPFSEVLTIANLLARCEEDMNLYKTWIQT